MTSRSKPRRALATEEDDAARALRAWGDAESDALQAEGIAARERERERARASWRCAAERRRRADDAAAARQTAFAHGLLDAAEALERAARDAESRALDASRRAHSLRDEADGRRAAAREVQRLVRDRGRGVRHREDRDRCPAGDTRREAPPVRTKDVA
jgi:hypothetical protein